MRIRMVYDPKTKCEMLMHAHAKPYITYITIDRSIFARAKSRCGAKMNELNMEGDILTLAESKTILRLAEKSKIINRPKLTLLTSAIKNIELKQSELVYFT